MINLIPEDREFLRAFIGKHELRQVGCESFKWAGTLGIMGEARIDGKRRVHRTAERPEHGVCGSSVP